jgi:hypothetical protein
MSHRVPKRSTRILRAAVAAAALAAVVPASAGADATQYLNGSLASGVANRVGDATRTALESSHGSASLSGNQIAVGAHDSGGLTLYGSWVQAATTACQAWSPTVNKGAMIYNPESVLQFPVVATSGWRGSGTDLYC